MNTFNENNLKQNCKQKFGDFCDDCDFDKCFSCIGENVINHNGNCECRANYYELNFTCINRPIIFGPIIAFIIILLLFVYCYVQRKLNRSRRLANIIANNENFSNNIEINPINLDQNNLLIKLDCDEIHKDVCVFGDDNTPHWKLNCGGYICNDCSLNVLMSMNTNYKYKMSCPKCQSLINYFNFVNRYKNTQNTGNFKNANNIKNTESNIDENVSIMMELQNLRNICNNEIKESNNNNDDDDDDDDTLTNKCNICFVLPNKYTINCGSTVPHMLCTYCYKRIVFLEKVKLCPFCRSLIKE